MSAPILSESVIDPVLSSTSATRRRVLPQADTEVAEMLTELAMTLTKLVLTVAVPVIVSCDPPAVVKFGVT